MISVFDGLSEEVYDRELGVTYEPLNAIDDTARQQRCKYANARKVIYTIDATSKINSDCAFQLREAINDGKMQLLVNVNEAESLIRKNYKNIDDDIHKDLIEPYANIYAFILETVKLETEVKDGMIKVKELRSMRKDRYTSVSYGNYIANMLEKNLKKPKKSTSLQDYVSRLKSINQRPIQY